MGISRSWPWILWYLWKNRNSFLFEGRCFDARELNKKAKDEADSWFLAQQVMSRMESTETVEVCSTITDHGVPEGWALCEIGMDWSKNCATMGAAWIAKNSIGEVTEHSRQAFPEVKSLGEAKLQVMLRALESMKSLRKKKCEICFKLWRLRGSNRETCSMASSAVRDIRNSKRVTSNRETC